MRLDGLFTVSVGHGGACSEHVWLLRQLFVPTLEPSQRVEPVWVQIVKTRYFYVWVSKTIVFIHLHFILISRELTTFNWYNKILFNLSLIRKLCFYFFLKSFIPFNVWVSVTIVFIHLHSTLISRELTTFNWDNKILPNLSLIRKLSI